MQFLRWGSRLGLLLLLLLLSLFCGVVELEITHKEETADRLGVQHNKKQCARFLFSYVCDCVCVLCVAVCVSLSV